MDITSALIGQTVDMSVYAPAILGSNFQNVKVLGILDYRSVFAFIDPVSLHANVYPSLPPGVPNDFSKYLYLKIEFSNGNTTCLGLPWINAGTIQVVTNFVFTVTVNGRNADDYNVIRDALIGNGITSFTIE